MAADTWDHSLTTLSYQGGCFASFDFSLYGPTHLELQVLGEQGSLHALIDSHSLVFEASGAAAKGRRSGSGRDRATGIAAWKPRSC